MSDHPYVNEKHEGASASAGKVTWDARPATGGTMPSSKKKKMVVKAVADCPDCARKVEMALNSKPGIEDAVFDFERNTITLVTDLTEEEIKGICRHADEDVVFPSGMEKLVFRIRIDCPDCARKVETALCGTPGVESAVADYRKGRLTVVSSLGGQQIKAIAKKAEEDIVFLGDGPEERNGMDVRLLRIIIAAIFFIISWISGISAIAVISYLTAGWDVLRKAGRNILRGRIFDENFLMGAATLGALLIASYEEAAAVMIFYQVGEYFQQKAVGRSRKRIANLMDMTEETVTVVRGGEFLCIKPEEAAIGDRMRIKSGEKVSLDCIVEEGDSFLDQKAVTGESVPVHVHPGSFIMSGSINGEGILTARVEKLYEDSTASRIKALLDSDDAKKASTERFITRFSRYYTPIVCLAALAVAVLLPVFTPVGMETAIYRALSLLVISCPCALVLSIPLTYFAAVGSFAKQQVLVRNAEGVETLSKVRTVAFDKTGTLTKGNFKVMRIKAAGGDEKALLLVAAALEKESSHPVARSILEAQGLKDLPEAHDVREIPGVGVEGMIGSDRYRIGRTGCTERIDDGDVGTICHVEKNGACMGYIVIRDEVKKESIKAVRDLAGLGVVKTVMLSGDNAAIANHVAGELQLDEVHAGLLPDQKLGLLKDLEKGCGPVCYIGDGMNDAPALLQADVGVAMGGVGSDAAIEAADVVIMNDDISKVPAAIRTAKRTQRIAKENIVLSLAVKLCVMALSMAGLTGMWLAVFADTGVCFIAVLNAMRAMRTTEGA